MHESYAKARQTMLDNLVLPENISAVRSSYFDMGMWVDPEGRVHDMDKMSYSELADAVLVLVQLSKFDDEFESAIEYIQNPSGPVLDRIFMEIGRKVMVARVEEKGNNRELVGVKT